MSTLSAFWGQLNAAVAPPRIPVTGIRIGDWRKGVPTRELYGLANRRLTVNLLEPDEISFDLLGHHPDALLLHEGVSDVLWLRNGHALSLGRLTRTTHNIGPTQYTISGSVTDYRGLLDRHLLMPGQGYIIEANGTRTDSFDLQVTYAAGLPVETAVWDIIENVQGQPGGDLGIRKGTWPATGATIPVGTSSVIQFGGDTTAWQAIQTIMKTNGGFDFGIDWLRHANLYWPQRGGVDKGAKLDYGGTVAQVNREVDLGQYANAVRQVGTVPELFAYVMADDIGRRAEGRWDTSFSDATLPSTGAPIEVPEVVIAMARYNFDNSSRLLPHYSLTFAPNAWKGPDWLWVGDVASVVIKQGPLDVLESLRVMSLTIALDQNDVETVTVEAGRPRSTVQKAWKQLTNQVTALNRR